MTTPSLDDLYTAKTRDQVLASILQVADQLGFPITAWQAEGVARETLVIVSAIGAAFSVSAVDLAKIGLLSYAEGDGLTLVAKDGFAVTRIEATNGTTTVTLTNTSGVLYNIAAGDLRFFNLDGGATYTSTTGGTLTGLGTLTVTVVADLAGTASNAAPHQIRGMLTPLNGVTCDNAAPLVGTDAESDAALRKRCTESLAALSPNGARDAYNYFSKTTFRPDGSNAGVTRTAVSEANASLTVYVASASGVVTGNALPLGNTTDLGLVNTNIQTKCVPTGFTATVVSATPVTVPVTATVYLSQGSTLDSDQAKKLVQDQLTAYFAQIPIGGYDRGLGGKVFKEAITGQIFQASDQFIEVTLTVPASDVSLSAPDVAVLGTVTITAVANIT